MRVFDIELRRGEHKQSVTQGHSRAAMIVRTLRSILYFQWITTSKRKHRLACDLEMASALRRVVFVRISAADQDDGGSRRSWTEKILLGLSMEPNSQRRAATEFELLRICKALAYWSDRMEITDEFICKHSEFAVLDVPDFHWYEDRITGLPGFESQRLGKLGKSIVWFARRSPDAALPHVDKWEMRR